MPIPDLATTRTSFVVIAIHDRHMAKTLGVITRIDRYVAEPSRVISDKDLDHTPPVREETNDNLASRTATLPSRTTFATSRSLSLPRRPGP